MATKKDGVNKSEQIRQLLKAKPLSTVKEIMTTMAEKGMPVSEGLIHFVKGRLKGRTDRKKKTQKVVAKVAAVTTGHNDALAAIVMVKKLASQIGGLKKLKALVDVMSE